MASVKVHGPSYSTYVRTARMVLQEKGVDYDLVVVDMMGGGTQAPSYLARHPFGKVPAFEHDGFALYETSAIARYVDRAFPGPALTPADPRAAARMDQVIGLVDSYAYGSIVGQLVWQRLVVPMTGGTGDEGIIQASLPRVKLCLSELERLAGEGGLSSGGGFLLSDAFLAPVFAYLSSTPESAGLLAPHARLRSWWEAMGTRASFASTPPQFG